MTDPIAPDALREAVVSVLAHHEVTSGGRCIPCSEESPVYAVDHTPGHVADAVLAAVAKHRGAEVERLREWKANAEITLREDKRVMDRDAARNPCIGCNYGDGPQEDCPRHGREYAYWVEGVEVVAAQRDTAEDRIRRALIVLDELVEPGPGSDVLVAILTGTDQEPG